MEPEDYWRGAGACDLLVETVSPTWLREVLRRHGDSPDFARGLDDALQKCIQARGSDSADPYPYKGADHASRT